MTRKAETILRSRRVALPGGERPAAVGFRDGIITSIQAYETTGEDLGDLVILPGLIDPHVHVNEPGRTDWEGFSSATRAAAAGGITLIADMPLNSSPVTTTAAALDTKRHATAGQLAIDVAFHGGLVQGNAGQIPALVKAGVPAVKAFLCHSGLDEFPNAKPEDLRLALKHLAALHVPLLAHAELVHEMPAMSNPRRYADYLASRPRSFESNAIALLIELCRESGAAVHIVHLADAHSLPMLKAARHEALPITVETCPHYLFFDPAEIAEGATQYKCAPPIREDREQLMQALFDGDIDMVASDHSPCLPAMKRSDGRFDLAWGGISSLQLGLPIVLTAGGDRVTPSHAARWMSDAPAKLLGVDHQRGSIEVGKRADFAVIDWKRTWTVDANKLQHRHAITPYDGRTLRGVVRRTYLAGERVYQDGRFAAAALGTMVKRHD